MMLTCLLTSLAIFGRDGENIVARISQPSDQLVTLVANGHDWRLFPTLLDDIDIVSTKVPTFISYVMLLELLLLVVVMVMVYNRFTVYCVGDSCIQAQFRIVSR